MDIIISAFIFPFLVVPGGMSRAKREQVTDTTGKDLRKERGEVVFNRIGLRDSAWIFWYPRYRVLPLLEATD